MSTRLWIIIALAVLAGGGVFVLREHVGDGAMARIISTADSVLSYAEISTTSATTFSAAPSADAIKLSILVYHIVRPSYPSDSDAVHTIALTPEVFDAEMNYLGTAGYHVVRFGDLEAYFTNGAPLPLHPIILSFDDGWDSQFSYALPILEKYRYPATFFVFTNAIGHKGFLGWSELQQLIAAGMTIGDHSRSHPYLTKITDETVLWNEIYGSKQILENRLHITINEFAYPFGLHDAAIVSLVEKAGYRSARGDYYRGMQSKNQILELSAMKAPTTTELLMQRFPPR